MADHAELSGGEKNPSPYSMQVDMRSKQMAYEFADEAARKELAKLEPYADLMVEGGLNSAVERARVRAAERMWAYREAGHSNDYENSLPGIWISGRLDYQKIMQLEQTLAEAANLKPEHASQSHLWVGTMDAADTLAYRLHLPEGMFSVRLTSSNDNQTDLFIYVKSRINSAGAIVDASPLGLPMLWGGYVDQQKQQAVGIIGRIEGADGSLWQNPGFNPDGSRRESHPLEAVV